ncbi:hypothetical protein [Thermocrispum municipale]|uniref:hypothetical protein n=1 Tax=Thermocrispum municipale TaxID=37926 RepID=UPI000404BE7F|nr:hypothetical protein [Thermocrispum municipale]
MLVGLKPAGSDSAGRRTDGVERGHERCRGERLDGFGGYLLTGLTTVQAAVRRERDALRT